MSRSTCPVLCVSSSNEMWVLDNSGLVSVHAVHVHLVYLYNIIPWYIYIGGGTGGASGALAPHLS